VRGRIGVPQALASRCRGFGQGSGASLLYRTHFSHITAMHETPKPLASLVIPK